MTGEEFLQSKDIWHHPRVSTRKSDVSYDIVELLDEFLELHNASQSNSHKHGVVQAEASAGAVGAAVASEGEPKAVCGDCGVTLTLVRPGKYQCDNIVCISNQ